MDKVSIIVPVFNVEKYIDRCINSILSQSYSNFELILINDGSEDKSYDVCKALCSKDRRIVLINQINQGASSARNKGLSIASGDYLMFVDSDDFLPRDAILNLVDTIKSKSADIVIASYSEIYSDDEKIIRIKSEEQIESKNIFSYIFRHYNEGIASSLWAKIYKRTVISKLFCESLIMGEDLLFNLECFSKANKIVCIDKIVYCYNQQNVNSLIRNYKLLYFDQVYCVCCHGLKMAKNLSINDREILHSIYSKLVNSYFNLLLEVSDSRINDKIEYLKSKTNKVVRYSIKNTLDDYNFFQGLILNSALKRHYYFLIIESKVYSKIKYTKRRLIVK